MTKLLMRVSCDGPSCESSVDTTGKMTIGGYDGGFWHSLDPDTPPGWVLWRRQLFCPKEGCQAAAELARLGIARR